MSFKIAEKIKAKSDAPYAVSPVTIAFLGDSVTQGCFEVYKNGEGSVEAVFDSPSSYSAKFKVIFEKIFQKVPLTVINAGISGGSAPNGLDRLERDVLKFSPDLVVVCFGLNDSCQGEGGLQKYSAALKEIFRKIKESGSEVIFMTPNMMNTYEYLELASDVSRILAKNFSEMQNGGIVDKYIECAVSAANSEGVKVCDCYKKWKILSKTGADTTLLLSNYLNHPARDMHWLFAWSLFDCIFFSE